ncbi:MAG: hypothetical protein RLZZ45_1883 [Bacteroidota bacterium]|jgi:hypothetical protein|nr:DUF2911 domain-containing protein [Chitinophagia bacterium]
MKKLILPLLTLVIAFQAEAQSLRTPAPSTAQTVKQEFGLGTIELSYSRPNAKGRTIFGDLVPYGAVWRTGANSATTLTFSDEVIIGGKKIPAGKYGLLSIPGAAEWTIIISKQLDVTSPSAYKQEMDVLRMNVPTVSLPFPIETFMILFEKVKSNELEMMIIWESTMVSIPVKTDIESKIMGQIDNLMNKDNKPYYNAAMYYMDNNKDLNQAATWLDKAVEQSPNAFFIWYQKARCLSLLGKKAEAKAASVKSLELAKAAKNPDYVTLNEKLQASLK